MTHLLIRFKQIRRVQVEIEDINKIVNQPLPEVIELTIPGGTGKLSILQATLEPAESGERLHVEILCNFSVKVKQSIIYNTHLQLTVELLPSYIPEHKTIATREVKVTGLHLISDQYSMIKDTSSLLGSLMPSALKTIVSATLFSTRAVLGSKTVNAVSQYLSLYLTGSKQKIIDYHRVDIEEKVTQVFQSDAIAYRLDDAVFEERIFAQYGQQIIVENGRLYFVFHP